MWHFSPAKVCRLPPPSAGRARPAWGRGKGSLMRQHHIGGGLRALWDGAACGSAPRRPGWALSCQNECIQLGGARLPMPNIASLFLRLFPSLPLFWCPCFCSVIQGSSISRWSVCTGAEIRSQAMTGRARQRKAFSRCGVRGAKGTAGGHVTVFLPRPQLPFHTVRWRLQQGFPHARARISCPLYK